MTTKGEKLLIYADGTWRKLDNSLPAYTRPASSTAKTELLHNKANIWVNDSVWTYKGAMSGGEDGFHYTKVEYTHVFTEKGNAMAMISNHVLPEDRIAIFVARLMSSREGNKVTMLGDELRSVNGIPMHVYELRIEADGESFRGIVAVYVDRGHTVFAYSGIEEKVVDTYRQDIENFVFGLEVHP